MSAFINEAYNECSTTETSPVRHPLDETPGNEEASEGIQGKESIQQGRVDNELATEVSDGGWRAWLVCLGSFYSYGICFGILNSYGVLLPHLVKNFQKQHGDNVLSKVSLSGSLAAGSTFIFAILAGVMIDKVGVRCTAVLGVILSSSGLLLSGVCIDHINVLYVTHGLMFGIGASLIFTSAMVMLTHYFKQRICFASGITTSGASLFSLFLTYFLEYSIQRIQLQNTFFVLSALTCFILVIIYVFKPVLVQDQTPLQENHSWLSKIININILRDRQFIIWSVSAAIAHFGFFVPYIHLIKYVEEILPEYDGKLLMLCIGGASLLSRILSGLVSDLAWVNIIVVQQIAFLAGGILAILLIVTEEFPWLIAVSCFIGVCEGTFLTLMAPISYYICGESGGAQAYGIVNTVTAIPITLGPPVAALLREYTGSYKVSFVVAGCSPILGSLLMCFVHNSGTAERQNRRPAELRNCATAEKEERRNSTIAEYYFNPYSRGSISCRKSEKHHFAGKKKKSEKI